MFGKLFDKKKDLTPEKKDKLEKDWFEKKSRLMESILGKEHGVVLHALIPYEIGGTLDLYYYPHGINGTGIATKELSSANGMNVTNDVFQKYELVIFTKENIDLDRIDDEDNAFSKAQKNISVALNVLARYAAQEKLNPNETCEFPETMKDIGGRCFIFADYMPEFSENKRDFGLLVVVEIFRVEMEYAMRHGGEELITLLSMKDYYPYSDMDREPVVS